MSKASYQHTRLPGRSHCTASRVLFQANTYIPFLACQAGSRRVCSPWGCKPEQSNVLAGEGIWRGRRGAPSSHSSTPVLIPQCSAHTSPGTASLKGHSVAACPSRCWHSLPHLLTLPNPATSSHRADTPQEACSAEGRSQGSDPQGKKLCGCGSCWV